MENKSKFKKFIKITKSYEFKSMLVILFIMCIFLYLIYRLFHIIVIKGPEYTAKADKQWKKELEVEATRGEIYDRNGTMLATSVDVYRIDFDLISIRRYAKRKDLTMDDLSESISKATNLDKNLVYKKLTTKNSDGTDAAYAALARGVEKAEADALKELDIYGVLITSDTKRFYPNDNLLSHTLGTVNYDGNGLMGLELYYDEYLSGIPGLQILGTDGNMDKLPFVKSQISAPIPGKNITLTIDETIQYHATKIAEKALKQHNAKKVSIIVSDPNTGEIRAIASKPDFNSNSPYEDYEQFSGKTEGEKIQSMWRNTIVSDSFEVGSTFKPFVIAAALEENLVSENDMFHCTGAVSFGGIRVRCWKTEGHGTLTLSQVLENSCNPGMIEIGRRLGKEKLNEYISKFGFGKSTGIDLPGESNGILKSTENITDIDLATISFGQTNSSTMLQMITAFNAIANGGYLIEPKILSEISHVTEDGITIIDKLSSSNKKSKVISEDTANSVKKFLQNTTNSSYKDQEFIEGYSVGLKTGTAEKIDNINGGYMDGKYISSVIAMAPVESPELTVYITVDEPSAGEYYGSVVAAPLARELLGELLPFIMANDTLDRTIIDKNVVIPDLRGMKIVEAKKILEEKNININISKEGKYVTNIYPKPGTIVKEGTTLEIECNNIKIVNKFINIPDFVGLTEEEVISILEDINAYYEINGNGVVVSQNLQSNTICNKSSKIILNLE